MALNSSSLKAITLAVPLAGAALLPAEAKACSQDYCDYVDAWDSLEPMNAQAIPTDGVLLLQGARDGSSPEQDWLAAVELTVTRDGQPIAGAVETTGVRNVLMWRPAEPLEPGAYKVVGSLDNPELDTYYETCVPDVVMLDFGFEVEAGPSASLVAPKTNAQETLDVAESSDLEQFVCCDGAMPYSYAFDCGGSGDYVSWGDGFCAALQGFGRLRVQASAEVDVPAATDALVVRELLVDGELHTSGFSGPLWVSDVKPFCTSIRVRNVATGETLVSEETCHGADLVAQLGDHALDPTDSLATGCTQPAYVCEIDESGVQWDPDKCTAWPADGVTTGETSTTDDPTGGPTSGGPDSEGSASEGGSGSSGGSDGSASGGQDDLVDHGCACDSTTPSPLGALALLGLGLLRPRRRRAPR